MGKLVQVNSGYNNISLPPSNVIFDAGETATLTDAEYSSLSVSKRSALTIVASGLPDPYRLAKNITPTSLADAVRIARQYTDSALRSINSQTILTAAEAYTDQKVVNTPQVVAYTATRPSTGPVIWVGGDATTPPSGALSGDLWVHA